LKAKYSLKEDKVPLTDEAKNLIRCLLEPDLNKRLSIKQIRKHVWLEDVYKADFIPEELFLEAEKEKINKDFSYNDVARYERNSQPIQVQLEQNNTVQNTENLFTEHALDSTQNSLLKNNSTKSVILAPFNSTRSHIDPEEIAKLSLEEQ
jgi:serine/threonine protein kinase